MHTNPPTLNPCPCVTTFQGKFALSLTEISALLGIPAKQLLYMARPSALNAPPPRFRFCILNPLGKDVYRVSHTVLKELARPLSQYDEEKIDIFLTIDEPSLLACRAYLWLSPQNCLQLYHYEMIDVSVFENGFHFDDLDIPRPILIGSNGLPSHLALAIGSYVRDTTTNKPCFTPSTVTVKMDDVYSLVQDLSAYIDFTALENINVTLDVSSPQITRLEFNWSGKSSPTPQILTPPKPSELDEFDWVDQPDFKGILQTDPNTSASPNDPTLPSSRDTVDGNDNLPCLHASTPTDTELDRKSMFAGTKDNHEINNTEATRTKNIANQPTESLVALSSHTEAAAINTHRDVLEDDFYSKDDLPESADETIHNKYYLKSTKDLKILMAAADALWGEDQTQKILMQKTYPTISKISSVITCQFKRNLNIDIMKTDSDHLASLILPSMLRGTVNAEVEKQRRNKYINGVLFELFKISTLLQESPEKIDKPLHEFLMERLKLKEHLAKVGAKALRQEFSSKK